MGRGRGRRTWDTVGEGRHDVSLCPSPEVLGRWSVRRVRFREVPKSNEFCFWLGKDTEVQDGPESG